ncbi:MAG: D-alanyl-D-alanine carboxypeptidase [Lachnospiraceae bacterium]|nr:D-alanyl-D-alanine carboxypeptidase [Lachnospiraceae bacterium]
MERRQRTRTYIWGRKTGARILAVILLSAAFLQAAEVRHAAAQAVSARNASGSILYAPDTQEEGAGTDTLAITAVSAVLMEGSTGQILYEKDSRKELHPASITKIMTLLLIFEAIEDGALRLTDEVAVSEHAASMGGSQVYLEPYEVQTVDTMIKCISIASANDASVAMAEKIAGSEEEFVARMNARAKELGMNNTHFVNCYGLDTDGHYSCAYDVALMSRELIVNHPEISNYSTVWMDTIIHTTRRGQSEFGLTNTNKLIRQYDGITGLKTGSTGLAKYCLSATARRNDMDLIAVIMAAPDTKTRFSEAAKLLNYGFANCSIYKDENPNLQTDTLPVEKGVSEEVKIRVEGTFSHVCMQGVDPGSITSEITLQEALTAPVEEGSRAGEIQYYLNGKQIGSIPIVAAESVERAGFADYIGKTMKQYFQIFKENAD